MPRALTIAGMLVALLILVLFALDLAIKVPFGRVNLVMDIGFVVAAGVLAYLSWSTFRTLT